MRSSDFNETRSVIASQASGVVLEIGFGSGYNLPFYKNTTKVYALEPSGELFNLAKDRIGVVSFPVEFLHNSAEKLDKEQEEGRPLFFSYRGVAIKNSPSSII